MMMKQPLADPRERTLDQRPRTKRRPRIGLHPSSSSPPHQLDVTPPGMQLERIDYHRFPQTQAHRIATEGIRRHEPAAAASVHCSAPADRQHRRITTTPDDREAPVAPPTQGTLTPPTTSAPAAQRHDLPLAPPADDPTAAQARRCSSQKYRAYPSPRWLLPPTLNRLPPMRT